MWGSSSNALGGPKHGQDCGGRVERAFRPASKLSLKVGALAPRASVWSAAGLKARLLNKNYSDDAALKRRSTRTPLPWANRYHACGALFFVVMLLALPAAAQIQVGDNLSMNLNGVASVGYTDDWGSDISSSHSLNAGGNGTLSGYYYNPNFLNFNFSPYYNQSSQNSDVALPLRQQRVRIQQRAFRGQPFSRVHRLLQVLEQRRKLRGPGSAGLHHPRQRPRASTLAGERSCPGCPGVSATFSTGNSEYSVLGANQNGTNSFNNFNVRSSYSIAGFNLNAAYDIGNSHSDIPAGFRERYRANREFGQQFVCLRRVARPAACMGRHRRATPGRT